MRMKPFPFDIHAARGLTLREKIAQLICVRIGSNWPPVQTVEQEEERVGKLLDECCVGGLALFNGGPQTRQTLDRLQAQARVPLLIASDIERGVGQQVNGYSLFPHAMAFGQLPGEEAKFAVEEFASTVAFEAAETGIHATFAPVADVSTNPNSPIISTRAFCEDPQRAAELVSAFINRVQASGLLATAKHFPGHGDTDLDSHSTLPTVSKTRAQLEACELVPFRAAIAAGCALIMTAHISYPALDATGTPATFSPLILRQLLREELGFAGVICSDSLLMAGARDQYKSEGAMAHAALLAGVDWLLDVSDPIGVADHLCQCVDQGTLEVCTIEQSLERIWKLKERITRATCHKAVASDALSVARKVIRLASVRGPSILPLAKDKPVTAILLKPFETPLDPPEQPLGKALRNRFSYASYIQLGPTADASAYERAGNAARAASQLVIAMVVRPAAWQVFGLLPAQHRFVESLLQERGDVVLVSLGVPSILNDFPQAAAAICTYSDVPASQAALVDFLLSGQMGTAT